MQTYWWREGTTCDWSDARAVCTTASERLSARLEGILFFFFQAEDGIRDVAVRSSDVCSSDLAPRPAGLRLFVLRWLGVVSPGIFFRGAVAQEGGPVGQTFFRRCSIQFRSL